MEIRTYSTFAFFELNYLLDYQKLFKSSYSLLEYYEVLIKEYKNRLSIIIDYFNIVGEKIIYNNVKVDNLIEKKRKEKLTKSLEILRTNFDWDCLYDDLEFDKFISNQQEKIQFKNFDIFNDFIKTNLDYYVLKLNSELDNIINYLNNKLIELNWNLGIKNNRKKTYSNPQKLALLHELGFFDLPSFKTLTETKINEITGLLLDADPKEFVYKNRLNLKSKSPEYQINKYTAYQYIEEMKNLISDID